jgi:ubiquinone/menaquinone biosynthesis C-methylase UbiE
MPDTADRLVAANIRGYRRTARRYERLHGEIFNEREQTRLREALARALAELTRREGYGQPRVLDFGCGSGNVTQHLLELGATVLAADVSPAFLRLVRRRFAGQAVDTFELNGRDLSELPDAAVDAAVTYSVLHHIPDYLHAIRELCRVIRPGGVLLIDHEAAPREYSGDEQLAEFRRRVVEHERAQSKRAGRFLDPWHYRTLARHYRTQLRRRRDPRYWPEGDIHVWPDDHIDWESVNGVLREADCQVVASEDYLLYREGMPNVLYERYRHLTADVRMLLARRT